MDHPVIPEYPPLENPVPGKSLFPPQNGLYVLFRLFGFSRGEKSEVSEVDPVQGDRRSENVAGRPEEGAVSSDDQGETGLVLPDFVLEALKSENRSLMGRK